MKQVYIQATTADITADEIERVIPADVLADIRKKDPRPYFQAFSIVQEGVSRPKVIGEGYQEISWPRRAVESLKGMVKRGLQFFVGHGQTNSHAGRVAVGEVVADFQKQIRGVLQHIAIGYFPDKSSARNFDVCSIEANVNLIEQGKQLIAETVENLTGIALGNSASDSPAFPGAVRMGSLQCFDQPPPDGSDKKGARTMPLTFAEIVQGVKDLNIFPHQLYDESALKGDRVIGELFRAQETSTKRIKELEDSLKATTEDLSKTRRDAAKVGAKERLAARIPKDLTDKQKAFIVSRYNPDTAEAFTDADLDKVIEKGKQDFAEVAKIFGDQGGQPGNQTQAQGAGGTGGDKGVSADDDPEKIMLDALTK